MKDYGKAIRISRKNAGMTQAQLAVKLNVTYQTVSKWENGINLPDISVIENICAVLSVSVDEFLRLASNDVPNVSAAAQREDIPPADVSALYSLFDDENEAAEATDGSETVAGADVQTVREVAVAERPAVKTLRQNKPLLAAVIVVSIVGALVMIFGQILPTALYASKVFSSISNHFYPDDLDTPDTPAAPVVYTVRFMNDGEVIKTAEYTYGATHRLPDAICEKTGYYQTGWLYNGKHYDLGAVVPDFVNYNGAVVVFTAEMTIVTYTIYFKFGYNVQFRLDGMKHIGGFYMDCEYGVDPFAELEGRLETDFFDIEKWTVYKDGGMNWVEYDGDMRYIETRPDRIVKVEPTIRSGKYNICLTSDYFDAKFYCIPVEGYEQVTLPTMETLIKDYEFPEKDGYAFAYWEFSWYHDTRIEDGATVSNLMMNGFDYGYCHSHMYYDESGSDYSDYPWIELIAVYVPIDSTDGASAASIDNDECSIADMLVRTAQHELAAAYVLSKPKTSAISI